MGFTLGMLADRFALDLQGDGGSVINGVCALEPGRAGCISYCSDPKRVGRVARSLASAVIVRTAVRDYPGSLLVARDPALAFARVATLFDDAYDMAGGVDATAVVADGVAVPASCWIGPQAVVETGASLGERCFIGPGCVVRRQAQLGDGCRLEARVYVGPRCRMGSRVHVLPGAVIGSRGFGNVLGDKGWEEIPQLGAVRVGDDVEIGANTTIDRGTLDDTVIGHGVRLDNLIQIAHNCVIGRHTAIAACVGIAGSTRIGARCLIGGAAGIGGHLTIGDGVTILGRAMVTKSLPGPGVYGSGLPVLPAREWRREVARVKRLAGLEDRLARVEKHLAGAAKVPGPTDE
ncbi:MAG TPA: UDP-3-O-(3-hydroxymyristoyl)glucosamine N-acyltransferase [Nevskiaceae bacterium]|nr:UDP-3-O-(3-hydroxymyristoyl)glucosamine N-acyltransferase [Nevskiaceae bacterium]